MKKVYVFALFLTMTVGVMSLPIEADFFQCPPACVGSDNADVMNGSTLMDEIFGGLSNDLIFGSDGRDFLVGEDGNDLIFGGLDSDISFGLDGNDTLIPGPDDAEQFQTSQGDAGSDTFILLAGETVNCQQIFGGQVGMNGYDVLHLIGFGPYVAEFPFGLTPPVASGTAVVIQDPIAGGFIFASITDQDAFQNLNRINGLPTPNVTVLAPTAADEFFQQNCNFQDG
jgi:Ca2+-binding RTX toxin-like protein